MSSPPFSAFDARGYRTVDARTGYAEWAGSYEQTVEDAMDIALLDRLTCVDWRQSVSQAADLACGTGRTGAWLRAHGVAFIDGVDLTPGMLARAERRGIYRRLVEGDLGATSLASAQYDLAIACLVDEHLADLRPLYAEAWRLVRSAGQFVLVGFHPQFIMASGMPTHYRAADGEDVAIETHVHLLSEHVTTALACGWRLLEMHERLIDHEWLALKPKWTYLKGQPVSFAFVWSKS